MAQQQVNKHKARTEQTPATETQAAPVDQELAEQTEATLDSIDEVLEDQLDADRLAFAGGVLLGILAGILGWIRLVRTWRDKA